MYSNTCAGGCASVDSTPSICGQFLLHPLVGVLGACSNAHWMCWRRRGRGSGGGGGGGGKACVVFGGVRRMLGCSLSS